MRHQIKDLQQSQTDRRLQMEQMQKQLEKLLQGGGNADESTTLQIDLINAQNHISSLKKSLEESEEARDKLVGRIHELQTEKLSLLEQQKANQREILNLQQKYETCNQEVRQLLRLEDVIKKQERTIKRLESRSKVEGGNLGGKRKAPDGEVRDEKTTKKAAIQPVQEKQAASKPKPEWKRPPQYKDPKDLSSSDEESEDDPDDVYSPGRNTTLDDHSVWTKQRHEKKDRRLHAKKSLPGHPATKPPDSPESVARVVYRCPVAGCTHYIKFQRGNHPPIKNGRVSDENPWESSFRPHAFEMRDHMTNSHPDFKECDWPKGFRPIQAKPPPPKKGPEVIDLLSDSD